MNIELDFRYFVRIPKALTLARAEGYITPLMYEILCYVHEKANRRTGFLRDFDIDDFLEWLPDDGHVHRSGQPNGIFRER